MMIPYLLIIIINFQAATIEFPNAQSCYEVQQQAVERLKGNAKAGAFCYEKLGGLERQA